MLTTVQLAYIVMSKSGAPLISLFWCSNEHWSTVISHSGIYCNNNYRIAGIIGEGEILVNWRITKIRQIKFQQNFMTTPTNTCYLILL